MKKIILGLALLAAALPALAAQPETELTADKIVYDSKASTVEASGAVVMKRETAKINCDNLLYHTKSEDFTATGNVHGTDVNRSFRSDKVEGNARTKVITATGNVYIKDGETTVEGGQVFADDSKGYAKATINPKATNKGNVITGNVLEVFNKGEKMEADGNVVITSEQGNGSGDHAVYYQKEGKAVLSGNAVVKKDGHTLKGPKIVMHTLENNERQVETEGRSRLIIE